MLILGKQITDNLGLWGEELSEIWNKFYEMLSKKYNKETYKKLIISLVGWYNNKESKHNEWLKVIIDVFQVDFIIDVRKDAELISLVLGMAIFGNYTESYFAGLIVFKKIELNLFETKKMLLKNLNLISLEG